MFLDGGGDRPPQPVRGRAVARPCDSEWVKARAVARLAYHAARVASQHLDGARLHAEQLLPLRERARVRVLLAVLREPPQFCGACFPSHLSHLTPVAVAVDDAGGAAAAGAAAALLPAGARERRAATRGAVLLSVPGAARRRRCCRSRRVPRDGRHAADRAAAVRVGERRPRGPREVAPLVHVRAARGAVARNSRGRHRRRRRPALHAEARRRSARRRARESVSRAAGRRSRERHDSRMSDSGGSHESMEDIERDGCGSGRPTSNGQT